MKRHATIKGVKTSQYKGFKDDCFEISDGPLTSILCYKKKGHKTVLIDNFQQ